MKRLLAAGSGSIYQLCKVFRDGESGPRHNPEFTLLEWYRVGFDLERLIDEVVAFLHALLGDVREVPTPVRLSYRGLFQRYAGIDGLTEDIEDLRACLAQAGHRIPVGMPDDDPDPWRDLILTHVIEGQLQGLHIVTDYPASQSALARLKPGQPPVAARFECYLDGLELANGFHELADASEQRRRFENENAQRVATGRASIPIDERLLQALTHDLPDCCGVALGFDRLLMWALGARRIEDVIAFDLTRA